jgi:hypothetical protein
MQSITVEPLLSTMSGQMQIDVTSHEIKEAESIINFSHRRRPSIYKNNRKKSVSREEAK